MESNKSAVLASSLTGIICDVRIRRSAGEHRTRLTSANRQRRRHWPPDAMARRCREFVDSRLRRSPPDRASAVPYGQAGENAMRFPRLAHRSAAAHKLHSTPQQDRMNLISGKGETSSRLPAFSLFLPGSCLNNRDRRSFPSLTRDILQSPISQFPHSDQIRKILFHPPEAVKAKAEKTCRDAQRSRQAGQIERALAIQDAPAEAINH